MTVPRDDWDRDEREALAGLEPQLAMLRRRHGGDPPLEILRAAHAGVLPDDLQVRIAHHLSESAWSRTLVAGTEDGDELLTHEDQRRLLVRINADIVRERGASDPWVWRRAAFLAPLGVALASVGWLALVARDAPSPARLPESTVAIAQPGPAAFLLAFDKPDVRLSLAALTWRGSRGDNRLLTDLKMPLDAFRQGDYAAAEREFAKLEERYPRTIEVLFYQGVSSLFLNDLPRALTTLTAAEAVADSTFMDDVTWYRAVAEQHAGQTESAKARLEALCRTNRPGGARACDALTQLAAATPAPAQER